MSVIRGTRRVLDASLVGSILNNGRKYLKRYSDFEYNGQERKRGRNEVADYPTPKTTPGPKSIKVAQMKSKGRLNTGGGVNSLVGKVAMKVKGKTKTKRTKSVKVSKKFRKQVKEVLSGAQARGTYTVVRQGFVGSYARNGVGTTLNITDQGIAMFGAVGPGTSNPAGARTLWGGLGTYAVGAATTMVPNSGLTFFTPAKILDAASILFNKKAPADPYLTTGNLSEVASLGGGVPVTSKPSLAINVLDSSVRFSMKNLSNRVVTVEIWECTPTIKFVPSGWLDTLVENQTAFVDAGTNNYPCQYYGGPAATQIATTIHESQWDPVGLAKKYNGFPVTFKKRTMIMNPQETCQHWIKGPKAVLDFKKLLSTDSAGNNNLQLNAMLKGFSVGCIIGVVGDQVNRLGNLATSYGARENYTLFAAGAVAMGMPISIEIEERYRVAVPEIAGFITQAGVAGTTQLLNLRKNKNILWNQNEFQTANEGVGGYTAANEENPLASAVGIQNQ